MGAIDTSAAPSPVRARSMIAGAAITAVTAGGMALLVRDLLPLVLHGHGEAALLGAVLLAAATLGILLCAYLALTWALASVILVLGPASAAGGPLLAALRILAPRLARRLTLGAAYAAAATGLALVPATAADPSLEQERPDRIAVAATLDSAAPATAKGAGPPLTGDDPATDAPGASAEAAGSDREDLASAPGEDAGQRPGLGWPDALPSEAPADPAGPADGAPDPDAGASPSPSPSTVEVQPGDSLWSITDDLLGPGPDAPDTISSLWPVLHDANGDVIGTDPHHLEPGQVLIVPAELSPQEHS